MLPKDVSWFDDRLRYVKFIRFASALTDWRQFPDKSSRSSTVHCSMDPSS